MRISMKSWQHKKSPKKPSVCSTDVRTRRPCVDSLRITKEFNRPCVPQQRRPNPLTFLHKNSCPKKRPICHCSDLNFYEIDMCDSSTNCTRSHSPYSTYGFRKDGESDDDCNTQDGGQLKIGSCCNKADKNDSDVSCRKYGYKKQQDVDKYILNAKDAVHRSQISLQHSCHRSSNCMQSGCSGFSSVPGFTNRNDIQNEDTKKSPTLRVQYRNKAVDVIKNPNENNLFQSIENKSSSDILYNNQHSDSIPTRPQGYPHDINYIQTPERNNNLSETDTHYSRDYNPQTLHTSSPETSYVPIILPNKNPKNTTSSIRNDGYVSKQHYYNLPTGSSDIRDDHIVPTSNTSISFRTVEHSGLPTNIQLQNNSSENTRQQYKMTPTRYSVGGIMNSRIDTIEDTSKDLQHRVPRTFANKASHNDSKFIEINDREQIIRSDKTSSTDPCCISGESEFTGSQMSPVASSSPYRFLSAENLYRKHNVQADIPFIQRQSHDDLRNHYGTRVTSTDNIYADDGAAHIILKQQTNTQPAETRATCPDFLAYKEHITKIDNYSSAELATRSKTSKFPNYNKKNEVPERFAPAEQPSRANSPEALDHKKRVGMYENSTLPQKKHGHCCHGVNTVAESDHRPNETSIRKVLSDCACYDTGKRSQTRIDVVQCRKKGACFDESGATVCASKNSYINQISECPCRFPPAFQHLSCTGNISGCCNCSDNN